MTTNATPAQKLRQSASPATRCGKRIGNWFAWTNRCDVVLGLLRRSGEAAPLHAGGYAGVINIYSSTRASPADGVVIGLGWQPCGHGGSHAGGDGDSRWDLRRCRLCLRVCRLLSHACSWPAFGLGMGHDHGIGGNYWLPVLAFARTRGGRAGRALGMRRRCGTAAPFVPVVVDEANLRASIGHHSTQNEAQAHWPRACRFCLPLVTEVIVVDSNSTDGRPILARKMGAQVIQEPRGDTRVVARACEYAKIYVGVFLDGTTATALRSCRLSWLRSSRARLDITLGSPVGGQKATPVR